MTKLDKLMVAVTAVILAVHLSALAADVAASWEPPANVDGTVLADLAGYQLEYAVLYKRYSESNGIVTSLTDSTGAWTRVWTTGANVTLTLPSTLYVFRVRSMLTDAIGGDWSECLVKRVGKITTMQLRLK